MHCQAGVSRSAAVVIAFLMQQGPTAVRGSLRLAGIHTFEARHLISPNLGFIRQLLAFESLGATYLGAEAAKEKPNVRVQMYLC